MSFARQMENVTLLKVYNLLKRRMFDGFIPLKGYSVVTKDGQFGDGTYEISLVIVPRDYGKEKR